MKILCLGQSLFHYGHCLLDNSYKRTVHREQFFFDLVLLTPLLISQALQSSSVPSMYFITFFSFPNDFLYNEWKEVFSGKGSR
jgi:hypothetical protein